MSIQFFSSKKTGDEKSHSSHVALTSDKWADGPANDSNPLRVFYYGSRDSYSGNPIQPAAGRSTTNDFSAVLSVKKVDLKTDSNAKAHHTDKFVITDPKSANPQLVVRRGQPFNVVVEFSKPYDEKKDDLKLVFETGHQPSHSKGTHVEFILSHEDKPLEWGAKIVKTQDATITVDVFTPPTCSVGIWTLAIEVVKKEAVEINVFRYQHKNPIYIIFNPWCKDDTVYFPKTEHLDEYILNDSGRIYYGSEASVTPRPWVYGQFESFVLDVCFYLLELAGLSDKARGNAVQVARKLSAVVNSNNEGGVLFGKWGNDFSDGTSPTAWTGSVAILEKYWKTKTPVRYGQCWVFAGLLTTVCRALGIPARSVSNFSSGHDRDGSITLDFYYTRNTELVDYLSDSTWNYHVWNEVWMSRPDLPMGYGGWQVIDATPQEISKGTESIGSIYCCGPTSVAAIKQGEVNLPYDGGFVFSEVNADQCVWFANEMGKFDLYSINKSIIGKYISTQEPNSYNREDITNSYKHSEDSPEEHSTLLKVNQLASTKRLEIYANKANDVTFSVEQDSANTFIGDNFIVSLKMRNGSNDKRSVGGRIVVSSMYYTGILTRTLKSEPINAVLQPNEEKSVKVTVTQDEYIGKLTDGDMLDVSILVQVTETNQAFAKKGGYKLNKPVLIITAPKEAVVRKDFKLELSFTNPLKSTLEDCMITVDGVSRPHKFRQPNVPPCAGFEESIKVIPEKVGDHEIIVVFNSKQLHDIYNSAKITIKPA